MQISRSQVSLSLSNIAPSLKINIFLLLRDANTGIGCISFQFIAHFEIL